MSNRRSWVKQAYFIHWVGLLAGLGGGALNAQAASNGVLGINSRVDVQFSGRAGEFITCQERKLFASSDAVEWDAISTSA